MSKIKAFLGHSFFQVLVLFIVSSTVLAGHIKLEWNAVAEPVSGYKLYYGISEGSYTECVPVGKVTAYTLTGLEDGQTYYIVGTAYNDAGESDYSEPVSGLPKPDDVESPTVTIRQPTSEDTYSTDEDSINLSGTASDNIGVISVTWTNNQGGSGTGSGTTNWTIPNISLQEGENIITVTAHDAAGNIGSDTLTVVYSAPSPPSDTTPPTATITNPTSSPTHSTKSDSISLGGTASDNVGVTDVTWTNSRGGSGTASGTTNWTISGISLQEGENIITVTAHDAAGNTGIDELTVVYSPSGEEASVTFQQGTDGYSGSVDSWISNDYPDTNYGSMTTPHLQGWPGTYDRALFSFDVSSVPANATVTNATFEVYISETNSDYETVGLYNILTGWNEGTVTYNSPWSSPGLESGTDYEASAYDQKEITSTGFASFDITSLVQQWVNGSTNNGVFLKCDTHTGSHYKWYSSEWSDTNLRPKLTVTYTTGTEPDTIDPAITIVQPTSEDTYHTEEHSVTLGGSASDNVGVASVTWTNNQGGSGTASGTDNWTMSNILLQEGDNVITVTAHDAAGNIGTDTLTVTYTPPDTTDPTVTITSPTSGDAYSTEEDTINLAGSASDNISVTSVTWTNNRGGSGIASETDSWTVPNISLQEGDNVITVTVHDAAGNTGIDELTVVYSPSGEEASVTFQQDTDGYSGSVDSWISNDYPDTNYGSMTTPHLQGWPGTYDRALFSFDVSSVPANATVTNATFEVYISETNSDYETVGLYNILTGWNEGTVTYNSPWSSPGLESGTDYEASAYDQKEITSTGFASFDITSLVQQWVNGSTNNGVFLKCDTHTGGHYKWYSSEWSDTNLRPGLTVTYTTGTEPDTIDPTVTITQPSSGGTYSTTQSTLTVGGSALDNIGVTNVTWTNNRGGTGSASGTEKWTISNILLQEGDNVITVTAHDAAGNTATDTLTVTYAAPDTTDPTVTITSPTSGSTYSTGQSTLSLGGTASDNVGVTSVTWTSNKGGSGTALGTDNWTVSNISLQEGDNVITVTAHDAAGNTGTDTLTVTYSPPDTTEPTVSITSPTSGDAYSTDQNTINMGGNASDNSSVIGVTWTNNRGGSGTASGTENWTISGISLQEGDNVISVTAHDAAGNTCTDTLTVTYTPSTGTYTKEFGSGTSTDYPGTLQDTFISLNTTNYVSDNFVNTYTWPQDKVANAIIMKCDLSTIPSSATIQNATLYLYLSDMGVGGGEDLYDLSVHKIINYNPVISACTGHTYDGTNSWTPNTQCDDNIPMAQADIVQAEDTEAIDKTHGYKSWSVTNMVQDWVSGPGTNYGMLVNSDPVASSDSNRYFSSTEFSNPDQRPKLVVTYTVGEEPDTTDPTITITQPTSENTYHTEEDSVTLGGIASDNVGVSSVTWTNNQGGSGTASGTINWTISDLPLHCGEDNIITVSATDASGNTGTDTITVDVKPFPVSGLH